MIKLARLTAVGLLLISAAGCTQAGDYKLADSFGPYSQRTDKVTLSAGDDQEVNTRLQEIDPWPRHAGNTYIVTDGARMANAVKRYQENQTKQLKAVSTTGGGH